MKFNDPLVFNNLFSVQFSVTFHMYFDFNLLEIENLNTKLYSFDLMGIFLNEGQKQSSSAKLCEKY
jgi:hypothetical protein